ncbi:hypothetical protein PPYR_02148 [Photinus pyralis]|uniref:Uncharacterized protein n=1 Tax=Photinus pyralis TaxID=7054 RepID=A0A5N4B6I9_PHOPY|nr:hypothetical protein PPYR_02148 [Photinus pyralis]
MPPELLSSISNIFLFALFHSVDRNEFGNKAVFKEVLTELTFLQEVGIKVTVDEKEEIIYFKSLKPKCHLIHYPRIFNECGPLVHLWAMRSEQKHRESKMTSNVSGNFKNILQTITTKCQLKLCHQIFSQFEVVENIILGKV